MSLDEALPPPLSLIEQIPIPPSLAQACGDVSPSGLRSLQSIRVLNEWNHDGNDRALARSIREGSLLAGLGTSQLPVVTNDPSRIDDRASHYFAEAFLAPIRRIRTRRANAAELHETLEIAADEHRRNIAPKEQCPNYHHMSITATEYDDGTNSLKIRRGVCSMSSCKRCGSEWVADLLDAVSSRYSKAADRETLYLTYCVDDEARKKAVRRSADQHKHRGTVHAGFALPLLDGRFMVVSIAPLTADSIRLQAAETMELARDHIEAIYQRAQLTGKSLDGRHSFFGDWTKAKIDLPNGSPIGNTRSKRVNGPKPVREVSLYSTGISLGVVLGVANDRRGRVTIQKADTSWKVRDVDDFDAAVTDYLELGFRHQEDLQKAKAFALADRRCREARPWETPIGVNA